MHNRLEVKPVVIDFSSLRGFETRQRQSFLSNAWDGDGQYACIATLKNIDKGQKAAPLHHWFERGDDGDWPWDDVENLIQDANLSGLSVHPILATFDGKAAKKAHLVDSRILYLDSDVPSASRLIRQFAVRPTWLLNSSPGKVQAFWLLPRNTPIAEIQRVQKLMIEGIPGTDKGVNGAAHLVRMPNTVNFKPSYAKLSPSGEIEYPFADFAGKRGKQTTLDELEKGLSSTPQASAAPRALTDGKSTYHWVRKLGKASPALLNIAKGFDKSGEPISRGARSEQFSFLGKSCFELGWAADNVAVILAYANRHLMDDRYSQEQLRDQLDKFEAEVRRERLKSISHKKASQIQQTKLEWLWPGEIPMRTVSLIEGSGDVGKTTMLIDLMARITSGRPMPFEDKATIRPSNVIAMIPEEDESSVLKGKLLAAGVDQDRFINVSGIKEDNGYDRLISLPSHMAYLDDLAHTYAPSLIYIEPLSAFMDPRLMANEQGIRAMMGPLTQLAGRHNLSLTTLRHWNKSRDITDLRSKGSGTNSTSDVSRAGFSVMIHPDDHTLRVMIPNKSNLRKDDTKGFRAYTFRLRSSERYPDYGVIDWVDQIWLKDRNELLQPKKVENKSAADTASAAVLLELDHYPEGLEIGDLKAKLIESGMAKRTIGRALEKLENAGEITRWQQGGIKNKQWMIKAVEIEEFE